MKLKKQILTILFVVLLFFLISSVSAADININDTQIASVRDNGEILSSENDVDMLSEGEYTYTDLKRQVYLTQGYKIILNKGNYKYSSDDGDTIVISKSCEIDGQGSVIDMSLLDHRAFDVTVSGVTFNNLTIKNANYGGDGGAIHFSSSGRVTNCYFIDNEAYSHKKMGGAIYMPSGTVSNCKFTGNKATGYDGEGGAICMSSGTVSDCYFTDNNAEKDGGAVYFYSLNHQCILMNCNFVANTVIYNAGGAVYFNGEGTVENCNFADNKALYRGGAIRLSSGTLKNCNFAANTISDTNSWGGAVYFHHEGTVENCNFNANIITDGYLGGAVYFQENGTVKNSNFTGNKAIGSNSIGGAVYFYGRGTVSNCNFNGNTATLYGGAVYFNDGGNATNCNFTGNSVLKQGGAIYTDSTCPNITGCIFSKNHANGKGGAIYLNSRNNVIDMCVFDSNSADDDGGAIYVEARYNTIKNSLFVNNKAKDEGGAVYINGRYGKIYSSIFFSNSAKKGYDIYCDSSYCELYTSILLGNTPKNAVYSSKSFSATRNWWGNVESNRNVKPDVNEKLELENNNWLYLKDEVKYDHTGSLPSAVVKTSLWSNKYDYEVTNYKDLSLDMKFTNTVSNQNKMTLGGVSDFIIPLTTTNTAVTLSTNGWSYKINLKFDSSIDNRSFSRLKYDIDNSGYVLNLTSDYEYMDIYDENLINGISISKDFIIDGNGHTIDGKNTASLFVTTMGFYSTLTLKNINFVNIKNILDANKDIYIENCTFTNCGNGLSLFSGTPYVISIKDSKFYNCSSDSSMISCNPAGGFAFLMIRCELIGNNANYLISGNSLDLFTIVQNIFLNNNFTEMFNFTESAPSRASYDHNWFGNTIYNYDVKPDVNVDLDNWMVLDIVNGENTFDTHYVYLRSYDATSQVLENNTYLDIGFNVSSSGGVVGYVDVISGVGVMNYTFALRDVVTLNHLSNEFSFYLVNYLPGSFTDLQYQIDNAGSVLNLTRNYEYMPVCDSKLKYISIDKALKLNGNGFTLDGKNMASIATITGGNVQILNTTFVNSKGTAVYIEANDVLINSTFINNTNPSPFAGGKVDIVSSNNVVIKSTFINNTATAGGGGAISVTRSKEIGIDSMFVNNTAYFGGAIYSDSSDVSITGTFINNSAKNGGAIFIVSTYDTKNNISKSLFISNKGNNSIIDVRGISGSHAVDIGYSIFLDNNCSYIITSPKKNTVDADYNWFGNTNENYNIKPNVQSSVNMTKWLFLDVNANNTILKLGESAIINVSLNKFYDSIAKKVSEIGANLPPVSFNISSVNNAVVLDKLDLVDGEGNVSYVPVNVGMGCVDFKYYSFNKTVIFNVVDIPKDSFTRLQEIINNATAGDSVVLNSSYKYYPDFDSALKDGIVINKRLMLNGNGHVIDGSNQARLFNLTTNSIELYNLILVNAYAQKGSVIYTNASGDKLFNSIVLNSTNPLIYSQFLFTANENWFGNTAEDYDVAPVVEGDNVELNNWLFLTTDVSKSELFVGESAVITLNLTNLYNANGTNSTWTNIVPFAFDLSYFGGDVNVSEATLIDGISKFEFSGYAYESGYLTASYYDVEEEFFFNVTCDDDSFTALQKLIDKANDGKVVLQHDYRYYDYDVQYKNGILINKSHIEIDGGGYVIDALNNASVFNILSEYVAIYNASIVNSNKAISIDGRYAIAVDNISFINNTDAISVVDGNIEIVGCYFLNNSNVVDLESAYDVLISNSTFINNTDIINSYYSLLVIDNVSFIGNDVGSYCVNLVDSTAEVYSSKFDGVNLTEPIFVSIDSVAYLSNNTLGKSQYILNEGIITSKTEIVISGNESYDLKIHDNLTLNATVYDDNGNVIVVNDLEFNVNPKMDYNESSQGTGWILDVYCYPSGEYKINASVMDSLSDYDSAYVILNVSKYSSSVDIVSLNNITYGEVLNVKVECTNFTSAIVEIKDDSDVVIYRKTGNITEFSVESLNAGIYTLTYTNVGDDDYESSSAVDVFEVYKIGSSVVITDKVDSIYAFNDYQINFTVSNRTNVIARVVNSNTGEVVLNRTVYGDFFYINLLAGSYNLTVTNVGDKNHVISQDSMKFDVLKVNSSVKVDDVTDYYYGAVSITYGLVNASQVRVVILDVGTGEVKYNFTSTNTTISNLDLDSGRYNITLSVEESESTTYSTDSKLFNVLKVASSIAVDGLNDYVYGDDVEVDIIVDNRTTVIIVIRNNKTGEVVFNKSIEEDYLPMPDLSAGEYILIANNLKTENVDGSSYEKTFTISKANSTIEILSFHENLPWGYYFDVYFDGDNLTDVFVIVRDSDGKVISGGNLTKEYHYFLYRIGNLTLGNYTIEIINPGDENITGCNVLRNFTIFKGNSTVNIANISSVYVGDDVLIEYYVSVPGIIDIVIRDSLGNIVYHKKNANIFNTTVSGLPAGDYIVNVTNLETEYVFGNYSVSKFTVFKYGSETILNDVNDTVYGENVLIGFEIDNPTVVNVKITNGDGEVVYDENVTDPYVLIDDLDVGDYIVNVTNLETYNVTGSSASKTFKVTKAKINLTVSVDNSVYGELTVVKMASNVDGIYVVDIGDEEVFVNVVNGQGFETIALDAGNYTAKINFTNDNYDITIKNDEFIVFKADVLVNIEVSDRVYGDNVRGNVFASVDGNYDVVIGNNIINVIVKNGVGTFNAGILAGGEYLACVFFDGDKNHNSNFNTSNFEVKKVGTDITIDVNSVYKVGDEIVIVLTPVNSTDLTVAINGVPQIVTNNEIRLTADKAGEYIINAIIADNENFTGSSANKKFKVIKNDIEITLESTAPIVVGTPVTFTVELNETVTGDVIFTINGASYTVHLENTNKASYVYTPVNNDTLSVVATFVGNEMYYDALTSKDFNVNKVLTELTISIDKDSILVGDSAVVSIVLNPSINGIVYIKVGDEIHDVAVVNGKCSLKLSDLVKGTYTINAVYDGDDKYLGNTSNTLTLTVEEKETPINVYVKDGVVVIELPDDATGNVTVTIDGKKQTVPIKYGEAVVDISDLEPGKHDVKVDYPGDGKYAPAFNSTTVDVPKKSDYPIDVNSTDDELVISLPEDATGDVVVNIDDKDLTVPIECGKAVVDISNLSSGKHDVKVIYLGDDKYAPKAVSTTINKGRSLIMAVPDVVKYFGGPERLIVYVKDNDGNNVDGLTIKITINGVTYERTSKDGQVSLALGLNSGNYTVNVEFAGNIDFKPKNLTANVEILPTIHAKDVSKVFKNATQYYAYFVDSQGKALANTDVTFNINGVFYTRTTNATGWAKLNINLGEGEFILTAYNPVTGEFRANNITVFSLIESSDLTKYYKNGSQFVVRIRGSDGNWAKAGETVTFNINGVFYTRTSNATGHVKLNINLSQGTYVITSMYKDCAKGNTIEVLPVLTAKDLTKKYGTPDQFVATLVDGQGRAFAGQTVTFNINGVFYNKITDASGQAKLNINLMSGEYIITSRYENGAVIGNKITVIG